MQLCSNAGSIGWALQTNEDRQSPERRASIAVLLVVLGIAVAMPS
jgi:hypothetical protein